MERRSFLARTMGTMLAVAAMGTVERVASAEPVEKPTAASPPVREETWDPVSEETWRDAYMRLYRDRVEDWKEEVERANLFYGGKRVL